jgi:phosphoribosylamine--glycine ligase
VRILIVGNGGREHALLWKLKKDLPGGEFHATRPNGGMLGLAHPLEIAPTDIEALSGWAASRSIDLAVIGPEAPLAAGLADRMRKKGVPVFGPSADAARIESSKVFAKALMVGAGVPTASYRAFTDAAEAEAHVCDVDAPVVVKASGLAAGKGAVVARTREHALAAVRAMMTDRVFGESGREVVIESFMDGEEISLFAVCDGRDFVLLIPSQDHKRVGEGDTGPNTGGMGAYAPVSIATPELLEAAREQVFGPTLRALADAGSPFRGLLYAGLMSTLQGLAVVEFNCRFGDPETQAVLPLLQSSLLDLLATVAEGGSVSGTEPRWREGAAVTTVVAAEGYPGEYPTGRRVRIPEALENEEGVHLFHAGTARRDGDLVATGGRVIAATGVGTSLSEAAERSRRAAGAIELEGKHFRGDIGWRDLARGRSDTHHAKEST